MLQLITATNEGIDTNSSILMVSFSLSCRQSAESLVAFFLFWMNFNVFLTQERKFKHKHFLQSYESQSHDNVFFIISF